MAKDERNEQSQGIIATHRALIIPMGEEHQRQMRECLNKSGRITFSISEVEVTELPATRSVKASTTVID
jgi:hypothetical protein